jgi:hypothetical protein
VLVLGRWVGMALQYAHRIFLGGDASGSELKEIYLIYFIRYQLYQQ